MFKFRGQHFIFDVYVDNKDILYFNHKILEQIKIQLEKWHTTIIDSCNYIFDTGGYSLNILISESHFSIHTYPEKKALFVDFFTCTSYEIKVEEVEQFIKELFKAKEIKTYYLRRGNE